MVPLAAAFGLKAGLVALGAAAWQGNRKAGELLRIKAMLMRESEKMGRSSFAHRAAVMLQLVKSGISWNSDGGPLSLWIFSFRHAWPEVSKWIARNSGLISFPST